MSDRIRIPLEVLYRGLNVIINFNAQESEFSRFILFSVSLSDSRLGPHCSDGFACFSSSAPDSNARVNNRLLLHLMKR